MSYRLRNQMSNRGPSLVGQLTELESNQHVWESIITRVNCQVQRMRDLGVFHSSIALGPIVLRRHYGIERPTDSGERFSDKVRI